MENLDLSEPRYLTIGVYDAITNVALWAIKNVPVDEYLNENRWEDKLWGKFTKATGINPYNAHGVSFRDKTVIRYMWRIVEMYHDKIK